MKKVAIVGVEGSGKTVLMAAMGDKYETPDANGVFLKPVNRETYSYYTKEMAMLRSGKWPLATESSVLELEWMLMRQAGANSKQEQLGLLSFLDFGGEVYRLAFGDKSQAELDAAGLDEQRKSAVERLKAHVEDADALIVLVNLSDIINGNDGDERTIEMNWLSQAILTFAYEKSQRQKSVALVFTQLDTYAETIAECGGVRGTLAKYLRVVDSNYGSRLSLFGVAAVDKTIPARDDSGLPMPAPDFAPQGLESLLGWIVKQVWPQRKHRRIFAFLSFFVVLGVSASVVGYLKNGAFKNWVDGQLTAIGWAQKETAVHTEPHLDVPLVKPVEEPRELPVEPAKPPKEEPKWIVGARNPNNPNLVAGENRGTWIATRPGYVWIRGTDRDEWKHGLRHPENSKLVSDRKEDTWKSTQAGYVWAGGNQTEWRENLKHPDWPHVLSSPEENNWHAEEGYKWVDSNATNDFSVVWNPGVIIKGRKTGSREGQWLKQCSACNGRGKKDCWKCNGDGRINCTSCSGSGRVEKTESERCWKCNGRGRINDSCPDANSMLHTLNPMHVYYGKHVRPCWACGTQGGTAGPWGIVPCPNCMGKGCNLCPTCDGSNRVVVDCNNCDNGYRTRQTTKKCSDCSGRGTVICPRSECRSGKVSCSSCDGDGWITE